MIPPEFIDLANKPSLWACVLAQDTRWGRAILGFRAPSSLPSSPTQAHTHTAYWVIDVHKVQEQLSTQRSSDCLLLHGGVYEQGLWR